MTKPTGSRLGLAGVVIAALAGTTHAQLAVTATAPTRNASNIARTSTISITFDRAVDPSTVNAINIHAFGKVSGVVAGPLTLSNGNQTVTLTPTRQLSAGEMVTVFLSHSLRGADGQALRQAGYCFQFRVGAAHSSGTLQLTQQLNDRSPANETTRAYGGQACDLDRDGWADLVIVNEVSSDLRIFRNRADGTGSFNPFNTPPTANEQEASPNEASDFNLDGIPDICTSNTATGTVSVHLGLGNGSFGPRQVMDAGVESHGIAVLDVNGDGYPDIVNANTITSNLAMFINDGTGHFGAATFFDGGGNGEYGLAAADMNNDGIMDLVVGNRNSQAVAVMRGNGNGTFTLTNSRASNGLPWMVVCGDVNNDGNMDVSVANGESSNGAILLGTGTGALGVASNYPVTANAVSTRLMDIDGDGDLDWVVSSFGGAQWRLFRNLGSGTFQVMQNIAAPAAASCAIPADFNNDGRVDLALVDEVADVILIYQNVCRADWNHNGAVNSQDLFDFIAAFFAANADFNGDGVTNSQDFFDFVSTFFVGC